MANNNLQKKQHSSFAVACCLDAFLHCSDNQALIQAMTEDALHTDQDRTLAVLLELSQAGHLKKRRELCLGVVRALDNYRYNSQDPLPRTLYDAFWTTLNAELRGGSYAVIPDFRRYFRQMLSFLSGTGRFDDFVRLLSLLKENIPLDYIPLILVALVRCEPGVRFRSPQQRHRIQETLSVVEVAVQMRALPPEESAIMQRHYMRAKNIAIPSIEQVVSPTETKLSSTRLPSVPVPTPSIHCNNSWHNYTGSDTVIVFVHGIFSNSDECWLRSPSFWKRFSRDPWKENKRFWPDIVVKDSLFRDCSTYLGGFSTAVDSADYGIRNCAEELHDALVRQDAPSRSPVISHRRIIFVAHSTGGIIVRYMLDRWWDEFAGKRIGLALMASPTNGSYWANLVSPAAQLYGNRLAQQLKTASEQLQDIHTTFSEKVGSKKIDILIREACEHHFIAHHKWIPIRGRIVPAGSAFAYGVGRMMANTDHFTIVKPDSQQHCSHVFLSDLYNAFQGQTAISPMMNVTTDGDCLTAPTGH